MNEQDASECTGYSGYSVRVTVQNKPVNLEKLSDEMHHFIIYLSPILDDEVRPYRRLMTFKVTRKPGTARSHLFQVANTFGLGCSQYTNNDNYGFRSPLPQTRSFLWLYNIERSVFGLAPSVCQLATTRHLDGAGCENLEREETEDRALSLEIFHTTSYNYTQRKSRKVESVIKASITNKRTNVILITKRNI